MQSLFSWELERFCVLEKKMFPSYPLPFLESLYCKNLRVYEALGVCMVWKLVCQFEPQIFSFLCLYVSLIIFTMEISKLCWFFFSFSNKLSFISSSLSWYCWDSLSVCLVIPKKLKKEVPVASNNKFAS